MVNIKHVFFDLDHTLWDFEKNSQEALSELFIELKQDIGQIEFKEFMPVYRIINEKYWERYRQNLVTKEELRIGRFIDAFHEFNLEIGYELANKFAVRYLEISPFKTNLFKDTHEVLTYLKSEYKLHIITNGFVEVQHIKLRESKLLDYFNVIVTSDEVNVKKPHPDIFNFALNKSGAVNYESVMIGDSLDADIQGANHVGMKVIHFNPELNPTNSKFNSITKLIELKDIL